jgi:hypothetical protein
VGLSGACIFDILFLQKSFTSMDKFEQFERFIFYGGKFLFFFKNGYEKEMTPDPPSVKENAINKYY